MLKAKRRWELNKGGTNKGGTDKQRRDNKGSTDGTLSLQYLSRQVSKHSVLSRITRDSKVSAAGGYAACVECGPGSSACHFFSLSDY
jgi:hypothetical protein